MRGPGGSRGDLSWLFHQGWCLQPHLDVSGPSHQFLVVRRRRPLVAVGEHQHLGVAVDGDEGFHVPVAEDEVHDGFHFALGVGVGATVGLGAGATAGASAWGRVEETP